MRKVMNINGDWLFGNRNKKISEIKKDDFTKIDLPHTWNNYDGQDGGNDYDRCNYWYYKTIDVNIANNETAFLSFNGVSKQCKVYIDGDLVTIHDRGFSRFRIPLHAGQNDILVEVSNEVNDYVYPQMADFTFFGGIYRDVELIITNEIHFDLEYYGGDGIKLTPVLKDNIWHLNLETYVKNDDEHTWVELLIYDQKEQLIKDVCGSVKDGIDIIIDDVHLWNGLEDPYLYRCEVRLCHNNEIVDQVTKKIGFRTYEVDSELGFMLNGKSYPLRGVSRHQCRLDKGWAINKKDHEQDLAIIKEVGANYIRLAHYQHDDYFYDLCDENGLVVWAEIPFISKFMDNDRAVENTVNQLKDLIIQNYHHTAIMFWGISNEISIGKVSDNLINNLKLLNKTAKDLDNTRLTTLANLTVVENDSIMNKITDVISYNHYFGWYLGEVSDNGTWFDKFHKENPDICLGLSEYGCEGIVCWHSETPKIKDYSEEYQAYYHEEMLKIISSRPYLWNTAVWNMFDFACDGRNEGGVSGRNNKGLVTIDRKCYKDAFYAYQAYWSKKPMLHICGKRYYKRPLNTKLHLYSNDGPITLYLNDKMITSQYREDHIYYIDIELKLGTNLIRVVSEHCQDTLMLTGVEKMDDTFTLPSNGDNDEKVKNWFENNNVDDANQKYSLKTLLKDLPYDNVAEKIIKDLSKGNDMAEAMKPEMIYQMMGSVSVYNLINSYYQGNNIDNKLKDINEMLKKIK